jgi:hypothetical protein
MKRITLFKKGALVQKCDALRARKLRLEIHLYEGGIIQRGLNSFQWFHGNPIPSSIHPRSPYTEGYASTLDQAMQALVRAAMS